MSRSYRFCRQCLQNLCLRRCGRYSSSRVFHLKQLALLEPYQSASMQPNDLFSAVRSGESIYSALVYLQTTDK